MRIGLDFDNTIVSYDRLFHRVAQEWGLIPADLPASKIMVRDHLRQTGREQAWTEMQGAVYGSRMAEAEIFPGVIDTLRAANYAGWTIFIISHKTRHPYLGPPYDLHQAARAWVEHHLVDQDAPLINADRIFFEETKDDKLGRIGRCDCRLFLDDLPEILTAPGFPAGTEGLLFDPEGKFTDSDLARVESWADLSLRLGAGWVTPS